MRTLLAAIALLLAAITGSDATCTCQCVNGEM